MVFFLAFLLHLHQEPTISSPSLYRLSVAKEVGSEGSAAGGGRSDLSEWQRSARSKLALPSAASAGHRNWPRCSALPVADEAEHKRVPGSIADEAGLSARKISGTPNGQQKQRSRSVVKAHTGHRNRNTGFHNNTNLKHLPV